MDTDTNMVMGMVELGKGWDREHAGNNSPTGMMNIEQDQDQGQGQGQDEDLQQGMDIDTEADSASAADDNTEANTEAHQEIGINHILKGNDRLPSSHPLPSSRIQPFPHSHLDSPSQSQPSEIERQAAVKNTFRSRGKATLSITHNGRLASSPSPSPSASGRQSPHSPVPPDHPHYNSRIHTHYHVLHTPLAPSTPLQASTTSSPSPSPPNHRADNDQQSTSISPESQSSQPRSRPVAITPPSSRRPDPLRIHSGSSSKSASSSSLRSARRLTHSPYVVPQTARLLASPNMTNPTSLLTVKDEPHTPVPLPLSPAPPGSIKDELLEQPSTPKGSESLHSPPGSRIGSSPGSMSMSQRRGVRPSFPIARVPSSRGSGSTQAARGLPTPLYSASSSRQPPYPGQSPAALLTAPLSPTRGARWNQSAPAVPTFNPPLPTTSESGAASAKMPVQPNPYQVSLDEIPKDFVLKKLIQLASKYWYAPHSADCHIVVPIKRKLSSDVPSTPRTAVPPSFQRQITRGPLTAVPVHTDPSQPGSSFFHNAPISAHAVNEVKAEQVQDVETARGDVKGKGEKPDVLNSSTSTTQSSRNASGRRGSLPYGNQLEQCLVFPLHKDYLTTQSVLFRALLSSPAANLPSTQRDPTGKLIFQSPVLRGAKVLPTRADRPKALYVPVPDPASFGVILHWLYWHDADHFNHCLSKGLVTWQGVIRNIEYLSLDNEIKLLAGKWWKRWVKPTEPAERRRSGPASVNGSKGRAMVPPGLSSRREVDEDDEGEGGSDSGEEADDEDVDIDVDVIHGDGHGHRHGVKVEQEEDEFADHVSARLGRL